MAAGFIYIMVTPTHRQLLKIGKTKGSVEDRAKQLSTGPGVAAPYWVIYSTPVSDCDYAEKLIHGHLSSYRYSSYREFFELPLKEAIDIVEELKAWVDDRNKPTLSPGFSSTAHIDGMTEWLGPSTLSEYLSEAIGSQQITSSDKTYIVGSTFFRVRGHLFTFSAVTSIQVWEGSSVYSYTLVVNTAKDDKAVSHRFNNLSFSLLEEFYRILTDRDSPYIGRWRDQQEV